MMKKSVLLISLLSGTALALSDAAVASGIYATHTRTPRPEPVSFADMAHAYKTASVCFLGADNCGEAGFDSGNGDYKINTEQQCKNEGFVRLNCSSLQEIDGACPYNTAYGKSCKCVETLVSCPTPQIGSGESCDGKYISCKCPAGVVEGQYGCEEYYVSPCETVCKKAYTDNCHNRSSVSTPYGCAEYWPDCSGKCKTAYNDNCRNRIEVSHPYGCESYYADCQAKCEVAKSEPKCQIGSVYYSDGSCSTSSEYDSSKKALGVVAYVTPDGEHGQVMSGVLRQQWFSGRAAFDISALPNRTSKSAAIKDFDSCANTDIIVSAVGSGYAAARIRSYAPTPATKGKWCLPAAGVLNSYKQNLTVINESLKKIGQTVIFDCFWSSTEYDSTQMWLYCSDVDEIRLNNDHRSGDPADPNDKDDGNSYIGVLEF